MWSFCIFHPFAPGKSGSLASHFLHMTRDVSSSAPLIRYLPRS